MAKAVCVETMILSEFVVESLKELGIDIEEMEINTKVLKFLLSQNIIDILGKNEFSWTEIGEEFDMEKVKESEKTHIVINYQTEKYIFSVEQKKILIRDKDYSIRAQIDCSDKEKITNTRFCVIEEGVKTIFQSIQVENECFDYSEIVPMAEGQRESIIKRLKPLGFKAHQKEYFELISVPEEKSTKKKSFLQDLISMMCQGNIRNIDVFSEYNDLFDYLPEIYAILQKECERERILQKKIV